MDRPVFLGMVDQAAQADAVAHGLGQVNGVQVMAQVVRSGPSGPVTWRYLADGSESVTDANGQTAIW